MPKERGEKVIATNRRARHDYTIEKTYEAGLVLKGTLDLWVGGNFFQLHPGDSFSFTSW